MTDRLYRSRDDRMLAGVAGGLADYWDADPSLIRVLWALLVIFTGGLALVVYIVMAFVVPEEGDVRIAGSSMPAPAPPPATEPTGATQPMADGPRAGYVQPNALSYATDPRSARSAARAARRAERRANRSNTGPVLIGLFLVIVGAFFLAREWFPQIDFDWVWPALLIVIGVFVLLMAVRRDDSSGRDEGRGNVP